MALRLELSLTALFSLCWASSIALAVAGAPLAGTLPIGLYHLYGLGAFGGWLTGNVYVHRARVLGGALRRRLLSLYLLGPPGVLFLLDALAPRDQQATVPLAPLYATAIYAVLFMVPVSFRRAGRRGG